MSRLIRIFKPNFLNQKFCFTFFKPCLQQKVVRPRKSKNTKYPQKWYGQTYLFGRTTVKSGTATVGFGRTGRTSGAAPGGTQQV